MVFNHVGLGGLRQSGIGHSGVGQMSCKQPNAIPEDFNQMRFVITDAVALTIRRRLMRNNLILGASISTILVTAQLLVSQVCAQGSAEVKSAEVSSRGVKFQSAAECLEMFAVLANGLSNEHAVAGYSKNVSSSDGASAASEWFEAVGSVDETRVEYRVIRNMYGQGAWALFWDTEWQRTFRSGEGLYFSFGKYTQKMDKVPPPERDEDGKLVPVVVPTYHTPNILNATVRGWTTYLTHRDSNEALDNWVNSRLVLYDKTTENGFVGFFYDGKEGAEIEFSEKDGFMPTRVRSFFREIGSLDEETSERRATLRDRDRLRN